MSGGSASRLHSLDGFDRCVDVDIAVHRGTRVALSDVRVRQVRGHYDPLDIAEIDGIPCPTLARTVCDLAWCARPLYERAADGFQRRGHSLLWLQQTAVRIPRRRGDGVDLILADIERRLHSGRVRDTWFEELVERCIRSPRLPPLARQHAVYRPDGTFVARVDLAFPSLRLAIEAHSRQFHTGPRREAFDQRRDNLLAEVGWDTRYVGWADATSTPKQVCRLIERIALRRASDLGLTIAS